MTPFKTFGKNNFGKAHIKIKFYSKIKYVEDSEKIWEEEYDIVRFGVFNLKDFDHDDKMDIINNDMVDEYDEYLKIWISDNGNGSETLTFRNSHVDMFVM